MKQLLSFFMLLPLLAYSQTIIVEDNFTDRSNFFDVSLTNKWEPVGDYQSAFLISEKTDNNDLSYNAIYLDSLAAANKRYTIEDGLRESTAFDYVFSSAISRQNNVITVEFDAFWDTPDEQNKYRIGCAVLHDYPEEGIQNDMLDSVHLEAPFGRPAYNFRILSWLTGSNFSNLFGGGGKDINGEFETINDNFWAPGFISGPGGKSPEGMNQYPDEYITKNATDGTVIYENDWTSYKLVITDTTVSYYYKKSNEDEEAYLQIGIMLTPQEETDTNNMINRINAFHGTSVTRLPPYYKYFDTFDGVRLFFNGPKSYIANVKITSMQEPTGENHVLADQALSPLISLSPIPASHILQIKYTGKPTQALVYNITGSIVKTIRLEGDTQLSVAGLSSGLYILQVDQQTYRFIVN
jgi:hypothetical protein